MCNTHEKLYKTCGCVLTSPSTYYWDLCERATKDDKRCSFGIFSEGLHDIEGRCPDCVKKWLDKVDGEEEKARGEFKAGLQDSTGKENIKGKVEEVEKIR